MEIVKAMKEDRKDLTNFVIHFTRQQNGNSSFEILKKIVQDGHFKCGWSFRGSRNTVLGEKPAVCFTETPLYGFLDYVSKRNNRAAIDSYGIFLPKKQLFKIGGRF